MSSSLSAVSASGTLLTAIMLAFRRALVSQLHPRMLLALLLPFFVIIVGAAVLIWLFWDPVNAWLGDTVFSWSWLEQIDAWLVGLGLISFQSWLIPIAAIFLLLPVAGILGVAIAAVFIMPMVLQHLGQRAYADLDKRSRLGLVVSGWNAIWVGVLFIVGWVATMPLWLIPPLAMVLPTLWWTFAFTRMLRQDALADHASASERRALISRYNAGFWLLGLICALLSLLPPMWLVLPVFSSLLFAHFGLEALRRLRAETPVASPSPDLLPPL